MPSPHCAACPLDAGVPCLGERSPSACSHVARGRADWIALVNSSRADVGPPPCVHRSGRWCCGEGLVYCDLGLGQSGIIEAEDCRSCPEVSSPGA